MTFVRNCPSFAAEVLGADNGAECVGSENLDGADDVVVAADPAWPPAAANNATANKTQAEATNRRGLHPATATSQALQISSRRVAPRRIETSTVMQSQPWWTAMRGEWSQEWLR